MSADADVLVYWHDQRLVEPELFALSQVVLAVPATQVSVERAFSALGYVLSDRRLNISEENLANVLFVKLNGNLFKTVALDFFTESEVE